MRTMLVPDVHECYDQLLAITPRMADVDKVIMLGDYWDTYDPVKRVEEVAEWVLERLDDPKFDFKLGNHDCHYAFNHGGFACSGYSSVTKAMLDRMLTANDWRKFKLWTKVGPYLVSHAGFHEGNLEFVDKPEGQTEAIELAIAGKFHPIFGAGYVRGGRQPVGGCTWLDWNEEFQHIPGVPQIVGHTFDRKHTVRTKTMLGHNDQSYCLDTGLNHIMIVETEGESLITTEIIPV